MFFSYSNRGGDCAQCEAGVSFRPSEGSRVRGLVVRLQCLGLRVQDLGFEV